LLLFHNLNHFAAPWVVARARAHLELAAAKYCRQWLYLAHARYAPHVAAVIRLLRLPFVPVIGIRLPDFPAAIVAFGLNYAAYFAEIFRAGIQSIDRGQYEGSKVLGLSYLQTLRRIVLPQMIRRVLPPMSNETITLVKDTSLIYVLALNDILRTARGIVQRDFTTTPFLVAAVFYLAMTLVLTWLFQRMEKHYAKFDE